MPPEATRDEQEEDSLEALEGPRMRVLQGIRRRDPEVLNEAIAGLRDAPGDAELLLAAALGALFANKPDVSLRYLHRFTKRFVPDDAEHHLIHVIALAQQNRWSQAAQILKKHGRGKLSYSERHALAGGAFDARLVARAVEIPRRTRFARACSNIPGPFRKRHAAPPGA